MRTPKNTCPTCQADLDAATAADLDETKTPSGGDFSVCFYCGEILIFNPDLSIRLATLDDVETIPNEVAFQLGNISGLIHRRNRAN